MNALQRFESQLHGREKRLFGKLTSPASIQDFLDNINYKVSIAYQSPLGVLRTRQANCFDGALFAAAALRRLGHMPLILHMLAADDDDHIIALYRRNRCFGAVAKSNYVGLRFREPIYRNLRELLMSYFEAYFNHKREKSLRAYTRPLNLTSFDRIPWMTCDDAIEMISARLDTRKRYALVTASMVRNLSPVDGRSYKAHLHGANIKGIYRPNA